MASDPESSRKACAMRNNSEPGPGVAGSLIVFSVALVLLGCDDRLPVPIGALIIRNGTVVDGTGAPPVEDGVVVVEGDRILAVGPRDSFSLNGEHEVLDAGGGTILPGLINAHIHHGAPANTRHAFVEVGVTTVCDLGSEPEEMAEFLETEGADGPAARGLRAGPILTAPGGYPDGVYGTHINYEVAGPAEAREAVADLAARGADLIKLALDPSWNREQPIPVPDLETVRALVDEAHTHGLLVRAHLIQPPQMDLAIEGGVDVIEHLAMPRWPPREEENRVMESDDPVGVFFDRWAPDYQPRLQRMAAQGIAMVPTVSALLHDFYVAEEPTPREAWVVAVVLDIVRRFHEAGGVVGVANDFNDRGAREYLPLLELEMLLEAGLSPMEVIRAATRNNALVCGREQDLGTLEPGKLADLIVVEGDPLRDLTGALGRVTHVVRGGDLVVSPDPRMPPELARAIDAFYRAIENDDHEARIALFSEGALMLPNHGAPIVGRNAIARVIRDGEGWVFRIRDREILDIGADGDIAYTVNSYAYTYHPRGEDPRWHPTKNVHIWKQGADGMWRLHVDIWNAAPE
jgi:imidazolonepropionase-like amidohydrolase/ketosteroid isomerase-like protein